MKNNVKHNPLNILYDELREEDRKYGSGGKKIKKTRTDVSQKREVKNLKKAWENVDPDEADDYDEFYSG
jgi:hypothetical protein